MTNTYVIYDYYICYMCSIYIYVASATICCNWDLPRMSEVKIQHFQYLITSNEQLPALEGQIPWRWSLWQHRQYPLEHQHGNGKTNTSKRCFPWTSAHPIASTQTFHLQGLGSGKPGSTTLPETNIAPENGWLEYIGILLSFWEGPFSGAILVFGSVPSVCQLEGSSKSVVQLLSKVTALGPFMLDIWGAKIVKGSTSTQVTIQMPPMYWMLAKLFNDNDNNHRC